MYTYNHRLEGRYGQMPVSLAVLGDDSPSWRPSFFRAGRWQCEVRFDFPTVKLFDYQQQEAQLEADRNPFAAVVLAHLKSIETQGDPNARAEWKFRLVKGLYDRGWTKVQIVRLFQIIDWVLTLPPIQARAFSQNLDTFEKEQHMERLSPTYQLIRDDALEAGRAEGLASLIATFHAGIKLGLKLRFGPPGLSLMEQIRGVTDPTVLGQLLDAIEPAPDLDSLRNLLPPASES
jgi:hypothetical protein